MTTPSPDQPDRRKATRLQGYDYAQAGGYFVTIVSHNRAQIFGEITGELATLSAIGEILRACWCEIPQHFPNVSLDEFVIMPNHLHGIIFIHESAVVWATHASPLPRGPTPGSLAAIIGSFKSPVSRYVHALPRLDGMKIWQRNYYEHIIRDENDLLAIRQNIRNNPLKWDLDHENPFSNI